MGLETEHVQSERSHYVPFVCKVCNGLADLDAIVTVKCQHPFCKGCIGADSRCPACNTEGDVVPLSVAQPLAHACMTQINVSCPYCMTWEGIYGKLKDHTVGCSFANSSVNRQSRGMGRRGSVEVPLSSPMGNGNLKSRRRSTTDAYLTGQSGVRVPRTRGKSHDSVERSEVLLGGSPQESPQPGSSSRTQQSNNTATLTEATVFKEKGNAKFNRGDFSEARSYYQQAINIMKDLRSLSPEEKMTVASLYCNRGACYAKERNLDLALRDYDSSIRISPEYPKAYSRKFKILASQGRLVEARNVLEGGVLAIPGDKNMLEDLRKTRQIVDGMQTVIKLLQRQCYSEAKNAGDALLKITDNAEAVLLSAETDASVGMIQSSFEKCDFVLKATPTSVIGLRAKGYTALLGNEIELAIQNLKEALKIDPNNNETAEFYRLCRKVQSDMSEARALMAKANGNRGIIRKVVDLYSSLIDGESLPTKTPLLCMLRLERAEAALQLSQYNSALTDARWTLEVEPHNVQAWILKAEAYIKTGRVSEARDELQVAMRSWARAIPAIRDAYVRAEFETKIQEADKELRAMVSQSPVVQQRKDDGKDLSVSDSISSKSDHQCPTRKKTPSRSLSGTSATSGISGISGVSGLTSESNGSRLTKSRPSRRQSTSGAPDHDGGRAIRRASERLQNGEQPKGARRHSDGEKVLGDEVRSRPRSRRPTMTEEDARRRVAML